MTQYDCTPATCEDKYIGWNDRNLPTTVTLGDSLTDTTPTAKDEFAYGPSGQRYYKKSTWDDAGTLRTEHTFYVGRFEEVLPGDQPDYSSIMKTRVTDSLLHVRTMATVGGTVVSAMEYLHRDHLGSVEAVTDAGGASLLVQAYDPFGERRKSDWMGMLSASERQTLADNQPLKTSRGYTGHEHLDRTGFIHMNGRLYDPQLGRFLSPDPIVAAPGSSQSWNSYSYVSNSPLSFVDPGGQFQAGIGCNVGYVMCMNGGNTSGGGGGSSQGSETATIRTYQSHTVYVVDWEPSPTWNPGGGGIYGGGDIFGGGDINNGTHGDINGGIFGDVWGGNENIQYTPFVTTFSYDYWATETRQIQSPAEEQSPASKPMGAGGQQTPNSDIGGFSPAPGDYATDGGGVVSLSVNDYGGLHDGNNNFYALNTDGTVRALASGAIDGVYPETLLIGGAAASSAIKAVGPLKQWIRVGPSYSRAAGQNISLSVRWGASTAGGGKYIRQIPSPTAQRFNQWLRGLKLPGNGWRTKDAGHLHIKK